MMKSVFSAMLVVAFAAGCASDTSSSESAAAAAAPARDAQLFQTEDYQVRVVTLAEGLVYPYSFDFLPDGSVLIAQLNGEMRLFRDGEDAAQPITGIPKVYYIPGRGGLMDLQLHPKFAENRWVYFTYDRPGERGASPVVARGTLNGNRLSDVKDILATNAWGKYDGHLGAYLRFTPDGMLYVSTGDRGEPLRSQDMSDDAGKVLRIRDDGSVPEDNPFVGRTGHSAVIYSYGHRDIHGMTVHPVTGDVWTNEHGDEINVERSGLNYGWPYISVDRRDNLPAPANVTITPPYLPWSPRILVSGLSFYYGDVFPKWKGNLLVGGYGSSGVHRVKFAQEPPDVSAPAKGEKREQLFDIGARVRDVKEGPDGLIYFVTDEEAGRLLRIELAQ